MKKGKRVGDIEVVAEIRKLDYTIEKPDQFAMDPSQISMVAYYCGLPGEGSPTPRVWEGESHYKVPKLKTQGNGATYPLEFLLDFLKLASKSGATHIQLASGRNTPLWACATIEVENADGQSARTLEFALAPRIEAGNDGMAEVKGVMFEVVKDEKTETTGTDTSNHVPEQTEG